MDAKVSAEAVDAGAAAAPELGGPPAPGAPETPVKKYKRRKPTDVFWMGKIGRMDPRLKRQLDRKLRERKFGTYAALVRWLRRNDFTISRSALVKYGEHFDRLIDAVKIATVQARIIVKETRCDSEEMERALLQLVQTELFGVLVKVQESKLKLDPSALYAIARATSSLVAARVSVARLNERIRNQVDKGVAEAMARLDAERGRGLTPEGAAQIRAALLEIIDDGETPAVVKVEAPTTTDDQKLKAVNEDDKARAR